MLQIVVRSTLEAVGDALAASLADPLADPMQPEWIAVPSRFEERWVSLRLAHAFGVAANLEFHRPRALSGLVLDAARPDATGTPDPWSPELLTWTILGLAHDDPDLAIAAGAPDGHPSPTWARRIADRFDRYHRQRPTMTIEWANSKDQGTTGLAGSDTARVQAVLWRRARQEILGLDGSGPASPPERLAQAIADLRGGTLDVPLPERLSILAHPNVPGGRHFLDLLDALATGPRLVRLFVVVPSPVAVQRIITTGAAGLTGEGTVAVNNELSDRWGRTSVEFASLLAAFAAMHDPSTVGIDFDGCSDGEITDVPASALARLQRSIRTDTPLATSPATDTPDVSVEIHRCAGITRQVEVLRDVLVHRLGQAPDEVGGNPWAVPGLAEEDVLVVCPDIDRYAPVLESVFHETSHDDSTLRRGLRVRVASRYTDESDAAIATLTQFLAIITGPVDAVSMLEFASLPPVRARFGFSDADLTTIGRIIADHKARWGLDPAHRRHFGVPDTDDPSSRYGTWQFVVDRLLLGAAIGTDTVTIDGITPEPAAGNQAPLLGRFADLLAVIADAASVVQSEAPIDDWLQRITRWLTNLTWDVDESADSFTMIRRRLAAVASEAAAATGSGASVSLTVNDVSRLVAARLSSASRRDQAFRGGVSVVPLEATDWSRHRAVAVLGVTDQMIPERRRDGDDLCARQREVGDDDRHAEGRNALLMQLLGAERLIIVHDGVDLVTGDEREEPVLITELVEALGTAGVDSRGIVEIDHPLDASDSAYFTADGPFGSQIWAVDPSAHAAALARYDHAHPDDASVSTAAVANVEPTDHDASPTAADPVTVTLDELKRFLGNASQDYVSNSANLELPRSVDAISNELPIELSALDRWHLKDRLVDELSRLDATGSDAATLMDLERGRGLLPVGSLGEDALNDVIAAATPLIELRAELEQTGHAERIDVRVALDAADASLLSGQIELWHLDSAKGVPFQVAVDFRVGDKTNKDHERLGPLVDLLALVASGHPAATTFVAQIRPKALKDTTSTDRYAQAAILHLTPPGEVSEQDWATDVLNRLVRLQRLGRHMPIPFFQAVSAQLGRLKTNGEHQAAPKPDQWKGSGFGRGDRNHDAVSFLYGHLRLDELLALRAPAPNGYLEGTVSLADQLAGSASGATGKGEPIVAFYADAIWGALSGAPLGWPQNTALTDGLDTLCKKVDAVMKKAGN